MLTQIPPPHPACVLPSIRAALEARNPMRSYCEKALFDTRLLSAPCRHSPHCARRSARHWTHSDATCSVFPLPKRVFRRVICAPSCRLVLEETQGFERTAMRLAHCFRFRKNSPSSRSRTAHRIAPEEAHRHDLHGILALEKGLAVELFTRRLADLRLKKRTALDARRCDPCGISAF